MRLYESQISGNCWKVRQVLAHRGLAYESIEVDVIDRTDPREQLAGLNPVRKLPTLVLDDGRPLAESNAILLHFAEGTELLPADAYERAQVFQWLFFEQYSHEPHIAVARFLVAYSGTEPNPRLLAHLHAEGNKALAAMDEHLSAHDFLVADRYTAADIALYAYTHVAEEGGFALGAYPAIQRWIERIASQPGHIPLLNAVG